MRRIGLTLMFALAATAGCGGAGATPGAPSGSGHHTAATSGGEAGSATVTVTFNGETFHLYGDACEDAGVLGWHVTAGDYDNDTATSGEGDFFEMYVSAERITGAPQGRSGGVYWALTENETGSMGPGMSGTFAGTDFISGDPVLGTFSCN